MYHIRNRGRLSIRATATALVVAAIAAYADGAAGRDCAAGEIQVDIDGEPLTRAERIARLDEALNDSLARFDECQEAAGAAAGRDAGAGSTDGGTAGADGGASGPAGATGGSRDAEAPESTDPTADDAPVESVAAPGVQGTEPPEDAGETPPGTEPPQGRDSGSDPGAVPDDIPEPDNDSVLEAQIRRAAMEEADPRIRAELWNEYRRYKGLPTRPLPDEDGEPSDEKNSE